MTPQAFRESLAKAEPPASLSVPLQALWWAVKDDWHRAHALAQDDPSPDAAWVHAFLHRVEGDLANARYWYRRAGRDVDSGDLAQERDAIIVMLLGG